MMIVTNKNAFALYMDARFEYGIALDQLKKWRKLNDEYWMKKLFSPTTIMRWKICPTRWQHTS